MTTTPSRISVTVQREHIPDLAQTVAEALPQFKDGVAAMVAMLEKIKLREDGTLKLPLEIGPVPVNVDVTIVANEG